jgi:cytochrome bd ubiquinol oxidase subunit II
MDIHIFWFATLGILLMGYAILDGFDLGVGIVHLTAKTDTDRRLYMNSIGPLWDGNEVWLVTFGGALFAAFPDVYATAFSGFYLPFMLLLFGLIFRAVSLEFRSKQESLKWRKFWDGSFFSASVMVTFLFGVAVGNSIMGIPIGADKEFSGTILDLLQPYSILIGVLAIATFAMHGSIFLYLKTEGETQARLQPVMWKTFGFFMVMYIFSTIATLVGNPSVINNFREYPIAWIIVVLNVLAVANIPRAIFKGKPFYAFMSSCSTIAALTFLFGAALFPNLLISSINTEFSLTVFNAASSIKTLELMQIIAFIGMPFVLTYTFIIYWVFRGKTTLNKFSY